MKRVPILISEHGVVLVSVFHKETDHLEDCWSWDVTPPAYKDGATQLIAEIADECSAAFLMALMDAALAKLVKHDAEYGTAFADKARAALAKPSTSIEGEGK